MLVIIALAIFWYGLVPVLGAFISRHSWRMFRRRFDELRRRPLLDYGAYQGAEAAGANYRFIGGFESLTDGHTLWLRNDELTVPVSLKGARAYMMPSLKQPPEPPAAGGGGPDFFDPGEETPERIRWNRISSLAGEAKVFVGGSLVLQDRRRIFVSTRENPLLVIFYDGPDRTFPIRTIRSGRHRNEYWNSLTPYGFILGAFSQFMMALNFLPRPAFRLTALTAFIALFVPLFPLVPPGLLFTVIYRRLWWRARLFRAYRDLARLPLRHIPPGEKTGRISGGELYGAVYMDALPPAFFERKIPLLFPAEGGKKEGWYIFGVIPEDRADMAVSLSTPPASPAAASTELPGLPGDVFAVYAAVPGNPEVLAARYTRRAYILEILSWLVLLAGIGVNVFFIGMIIGLLSRFA